MCLNSLCEKKLHVHNTLWHVIRCHGKEKHRRCCCFKSISGSLMSMLHSTDFSHQAEIIRSQIGFACFVLFFPIKYKKNQLPSKQNITHHNDYPVISYFLFDKDQQWKLYPLRGRTTCNKPYFLALYGRQLYSFDMME